MAGRRRAAPRSPCTCATTPSFDEWRLRQIVRYSDHIACRSCSRSSARGTVRRRRATTRPRARAGQPGERAVDPAQIGHHRRAVQGVLTTSRTRSTSRGRASTSRPKAWCRIRRLVRAGEPFDLYDPQRRHGVKLYVRRVFITDDLDGLMPRCLRFVRGVVDPEDLQLNVSRETLQHSPVLGKIRKDLIKRVLDELERGPRRRTATTRASGRTSARCSRKASTRTTSSASACSSSPASAAPRASWVTSPITSPG